MSAIRFQNHDTEIDLASIEKTWRCHWKSATEGWFENKTTGEIEPFFYFREGDDIQFWLKGQVYKTAVVSGKAKRQSGGVGSARGNEVVSPMPGTVLKILAKAGESVEAGSPVIVMESMKMEMTLSAPSSGNIKQIHVKEGQLVEMKQTLISLEPA